MVTRFALILMTIIQVSHRDIRIYILLTALEDRLIGYLQEECAFNGHSDPGCSY